MARLVKSARMLGASNAVCWWISWSWTGKKSVAATTKNNGKTTALLQLGLPDIFIPQGTQQEALAEIKLDEKGIEEQIIAFIKG